MLEQTHKQALRIADLLRQRGEKVAVADGATGGLVAASLLTVPGALDFFVGGGVVYSFRARDILFDLPRDSYAGMRGASEEYALLQARAIRDNFGAQWGLAESGSVGGSSHPSGGRARRVRIHPPDRDRQRRPDRQYGSLCARRAGDAGRGAAALISRSA